MPHTPRREENLLGAVGLAVADAENAALAAVLPGGTAALAAALLTVANFGGQARLGTLIAALGITHSGAVRQVDRLAADGLVRRAPDALDGRGVVIAVTPAGRRAVRRLRRAREETLAAWLAPLAPAERATLTALVERMLDARVDGRRRAIATCRTCDPVVCGHPDRCPVTIAADRAEARR